MLILAFVVATYVFHRAIGDGLIWLGEKMGGTRQEAFRASAADQAGTPGTAVAHEAGSNPPATGLPASKPEIQERPITGSTQSSFPTINPPSTATPIPETSFSAVAPGNGPEPGQSEYLQALQILRANSGIGTVEVVRLLWISVEKGNPSAEIVLADLYWHAKGVARNCDQTRILLTAAARKGSAVAQKQLQQFQQEGCE
jgi:TPR repeat protein